MKPAEPPLVLVRRRFGQGIGAFRDHQEAEAWAREQLWYPRVVHRRIARGYWVWLLRPAGSP